MHVLHAGFQKVYQLIVVQSHTGHLVEALMSKVAAQLGKEGDATPFIDLSYQKISDMLHQCGYQQRGWETMYNGHTGRQLKVLSWRFLASHMPYTTLSLLDCFRSLCGRHVAISLQHLPNCRELPRDRGWPSS